MSDAVPGPVTRLLVQWGEGRQDALPALMPLIYDELRGLARRYVRQEGSANTLRSVELVHEAYFRLVDQRHMSWKNRAQFIGVAAQLMRRILVDRVRRQRALKRGAAASKLSLTDAMDVPETREVDLLQLDDALQSLEQLDPQQGRIGETWKSSSRVISMWEASSSRLKQRRPLPNTNRFCCRVSASATTALSRRLDMVEWASSTKPRIQSWGGWWRSNSSRPQSQRTHRRSSGSGGKPERHQP